MRGGRLPRVEGADDPFDAVWSSGTTGRIAVEAGELEMMGRKGLENVEEHEGPTTNIGSMRTVIQ
jgi:hypothetical protein